MVSGIGSLVETIVGIVNGFGIGHVDRDYSDKDRKKREEAAWREKHGSKWRDKK